MQPKTLVVVFVCILMSFTTMAQTRNPFESLGKKVEVLTLTNGKYDEFFDEDSI
jgi:hypothetical protein